MRLVLPGVAAAVLLTLSTACSSVATAMSAPLAPPSGLAVEGAAEVVVGINVAQPRFSWAPPLCTQVCPQPA